MNKSTTRRRARTALLAAAGLGVCILLLPLSTRTGSSGPGAVTSRTAVSATEGTYRDATLPVDRRVADLLGRMTLAEKVGQMTQAERATVDRDTRKITSLALGSVLSGGGSVPKPNTPTAWADMVDRYQSAALETRLGIPLVYGVDAVHGHGNLHGATIFPHDMGMGATRDPRLALQEGQVTASEVRATGILWDFAPCVCVSRDERWGRTYESFGEDPALVSAMETEIDGLQGTGAGRYGPGHVLAGTKHFAGDGDTTYGTSSTGDHFRIDQGITRTSRKRFEEIDLAPYVPAVRVHHTGTVMPSYSSVDLTDDGVGPVRMHADGALVQGYLKDELGFDGFVISDDNAIEMIPGDLGTQVRTSVNAGVDMFMEPDTPEEFEAALTAEVSADRVSQARIDDAVSRILRQKFLLGLFEHPYADRAGAKDIGGAAHRAIARKAAAESQVLLKNAGGVLPLKENARIYVAGRSADDIGNQTGGWTITWQGGSGADRVPGTSVLDGIVQVAPGATVVHSADASASTAGSDVGVVVVGETPYSEGYGDVGGPSWGDDPGDAGREREAKSLSLEPDDKAVVDKVCTALPACVVLVVSGRPQVVTDQLGEADALVASGLPGSEGEGVADVLFGRVPFTGRLSMTWPRSEAQVPINVGDASYDPLFPFGWGLRTDSARARLQAARTAAVRAHASTRAVEQVDAALRPGAWTSSGAVRDRATVTADLGAAVLRLRAAGVDRTSLSDVAVSVLRDVVMAAHPVPDAATSARVADADHALLVGRPDTAAALLAHG